MKILIQVIEGMEREYSIGVFFLYVVETHSLCKIFVYHASFPSWIISMSNLSSHLLFLFSIHNISILNTSHISVSLHSLISPSLLFFMDLSSLQLFLLFSYLFLSLNSLTNSSPDMQRLNGISFPFLVLFFPFLPLLFVLTSQQFFLLALLLSFSGLLHTKFDRLLSIPFALSSFSLLLFV